MPAPPRVSAPPYAIVRVFYATDRNLINFNSARAQYGADRGDSVTYGTCEVSIPREHRLGELEAPSILKLEFRADPEKHVVVLNTIRMDKDRYFSQLAAKIKASPAKKAFVFVHGYNVTFQDAARRSAQLSYDLGFDGAPVFYSWPSQGTTLAYPTDETNVEWTQEHLTEFLSDFAARAKAEDIYLIAHSMGNRALTRALAAAFAQNPELRKKFRTIVLAAPDIDADIFRTQIVPKITGTNELVTLYASSADEALTLSQKFHTYPRAGESGPKLVLASGIQTIDATGVSTGFLGHSYFADNDSVLGDLFDLVHNGRSAELRKKTLQAMEIASGRYWIIVRPSK